METITHSQVQELVKKLPEMKLPLAYHLLQELAGKDVEALFQADLEGLIKNYALNSEIEILSLSIQPDHVHLFVSAPPRFSPSQLINLFKGATARELLKRYPNLNGRSAAKRRGSLWTRSYYVGTAGTVSAKTIEHYIAECQDE